jgi:hypothetical protein
MQTGPVIKTTYSGPTNIRDAIIIASHRRDSDTLWRAIHKYNHSLNQDENHRAAAEKLIERWPLNAKGSIDACGYDYKHRYFIFALEAYN